MTGFYKDYADASDTHQNSAEASATAAEQSATQAATSASEAATSATQAATSASEAATSASQAAASVSSIDLSPYAELAGADFTGTVTADGLTVSNVTNSVLKLESTGTGLGSGAVIGDIQFYGNDASVPAAGIKAGIKVETVAALGDDAQMKFTTSDGATNNIDRMLIANNGDISFYEDTGTTPKFFWDASAESLTVGGTGDDGYNLNVESAADTSLSVFSSNNPSRAVISTHSGNEMRLESRGGGSASMLTMYTGAIGSPTERLRIDSSGNVGIGTTAPDEKLHVEGNILVDAYNNDGEEGGIFFREGFTDSNKYNASITLYDHSDNDPVSPDGLSINGYDGISFCTNSNDRQERMRIDISGNVGIGTSNPSQTLDVAGNIQATGTRSIAALYDSNHYMRLEGNSSGGILKGTDGGVVTTLVRSYGDSYFNGGNLGIGTTSPNRQLHVSGSGTTVAAKVEATDGSQSSLDLQNTEGWFRLINDGGSLSVYDQADSVERFRINTSGNVGIGTSNPATNLHVSSSGDTIARITSADGNGAFLDLGDASDPDGGRIVYDSGSNLALYTVSTERMRIDSSGNVGIGTTSPANPFHAYHATTNIVGMLESGDTTCGIDLKDSTATGRITNTSGKLSIQADTGAEGADSRIDFKVDGSEKMRIDSSGNVGIGTSSPNDKFHVANGSTGAGYLRIANNEGYARLGTDGGNLLLDVGGSEKARIDSSGNVGIGTTSPSASGSRQTLHINSDTNGSALRLSQGSNSSLIRYDDSDGLQIGTIANKDLRLETNDTERVRIDTSGRVGIGTSNPNSALHVITSSNFLQNFLKLESSSGTRARIGSNLQDNAYLELYDGSGNLKTNFRTDGNKSFIAGGGNFGIGTTNPATELDVNGTITANAISLGDSESIAVGADDDFTITHDGTDTTIQNDTGDLIIDVNDSAGKLEIQHEGVRAVTITDSEVAFYMGSGSFPFFSISTANGPTFYSDIEMNGTTTIDGRDVSVDGAKLDKIPEKTIRTRFQKRGQSNTVGFLTLTNTLQNVGTVFRLNASVTTAVEHILDLNISANFLDINSTNDGEFIVAVTAPAPANETTVNLGTVISTSFTGSTFQFVLSGDLTKHFSPYCGMSVNSDGSSAFGFNTYDGWSYDPFYNRTTVECYLYQANKPTTGDTVYLHPFDWETSGTVLDGDTYPIEAYNALGTTNQNQFHQIYLGYYKDDKSFQIKAREVTTQENIQISRISGTYSNIIGI